MFAKEKVISEQNPLMKRITRLEKILVEKHRLSIQAKENKKRYDENQERKKKQAEENEKKKKTAEQDKKKEPQKMQSEINKYKAKQKTIENKSNHLRITNSDKDHEY